MISPLQRAAALALLLIATATSFAQASGADKTAPPKPNVIVIIADDLGWADVSTYGLKRVPTPNIDSMARRGVAFSSGYVAAPVCAVSRAGLMTGKYPQRLGFEYNFDESNPGRGLPTTERTIADYLHTAGYRTAAVGKWHQGDAPGMYPTERGFDEFYGYLGGTTVHVRPGTPGFVEVDGGGQVPGAVERVGDTQVITGPDRKVVDNFDRYLTDDLTRQAIDFTDRSMAANKPFFLYLAYSAPHRPFQAPKKWYDRFPEIADHKRRTYVAMIAAMDDNIGQLTDALKRKGAYDNTLIVFLSDNGCPPQFGICDCSHPVNAGKFTQLEGGIRVPFVLSWPKGLPPQGINDRPVSSLDVLPTILKAAGAPAAPGLDGVDLIAVATDRAAKRPLFWRQSPVLSMREGKWKLWKSLDRNTTKLYDLERDAGETSDLAQRFPEVVQRLDQELMRWNGTLAKKPLWPNKMNYNMDVCGRTTQAIY